MDTSVPLGLEKVETMAKLEFGYEVGRPQVVVTLRPPEGIDSRGFEAIRSAIADYPGVAEVEWLSTEGDKLLVTFADDRHDVRVSDMSSRLSYFLRQLGVRAPSSS